MPFAQEKKSKKEKSSERKSSEVMFRPIEYSPLALIEMWGGGPGVIVASDTRCIKRRR
jgi:hypothetical protein